MLSNHLLLCLAYFSLMLSRSSPVITNGRISFSWLKSLYVYIPRPRCPSIRLQTLHCFVNDAALHTGAGVPLSQSAASSYKDPAADAGLSGMMPRLKTPNLTPSEKSLGVKVTGLQVLGSGHGHRRGHRLTDHGTDQVAPSILHKVSVSPGGENLLTALGCVLDHGLLSVGTTRLQPSLVTHCSLGGARAGLPRPPNPTDSSSAQGWGLRLPHPDVSTDAPRGLADPPPAPRLPCPVLPTSCLLEPHSKHPGPFCDGPPSAPGACCQGPGTHSLPGVGAPQGLALDWGPRGSAGG